MAMSRIIFLLFFLIGYCRSYSQDWIEIGAFNAAVTRLYTDTSENLMYIGGGFKKFDSLTVNGIMKWDGVNGFPLGAGRTKDCWQTGCFDLVLLQKFQGDLYIGRVNDSIDGVTAKGLARWNPEIGWHDVGEGVLDSDHNSAIPFDAYPFNNQLFIGGAFDKAGDVFANSIAVWQDDSWESLDFPESGFPGSPNFITSVALFAGNLYAAGNFRVALNGIYTDDIAMLTPSGWIAVGGGLLGGESYIQDMIVYKNELYICGYFRSLDGNIGNKIMRWNGTQWLPVGGGLCDPFDIAERMLVYEDKLLVAGIFNCVNNGLPCSNIAAWDGDQWCSFGASHFNNKIRDMAAWQNNLYVGGGFTQIDGQPVKYFAKWIGDHATDTCSASISSIKEWTDLNTLQLHITPNPTHQNVQITLQGLPAEAPLQWSVADALGREVWQGQGAGHTINIAVADWPPGLYYCFVRTIEGKSAVGRFLKN